MPRIRLQRPEGDPRGPLDVEWMNTASLVAKMIRTFPPSYYFTVDVRSAGTNWNGTIPKMMKLGHHIGATQQSVSERWPIVDRNTVRGYPRLNLVPSKEIRVKATDGSSSTNGFMRWYYHGPQPTQTVAQQCQDAENYESSSFPEIRSASPSPRRTTRSSNSNRNQSSCSSSGSNSMVVSSDAGVTGGTGRVRSMGKECRRPSY
jgi:hypothetical protein